MWSDGWSDVVRVLVIGAAAYATLVVLLRLSGKRTLAKLNAFDLVVTVAVGSTLATILLSSEVSYVEGLAALALLVALQFVAALISSRARAARMALKSTPTLLVSHGRFRDDALRRQRVSADEVRQAMRSSGFGDLAGVAAVVLETDGSLSVISTDQRGDGSAMVDVDAVPTVSTRRPRVRDRRTPTTEEDAMSVAGRMLETYPQDLGGVDRGELVACIEACLDCAQACTACADACLSEESVAQLTKCIRTNSDCADICAATARVLSRHTGYDANLTAEVLRSCVTACRACADECGRHAEHHDHCRICADVCRQCERMCDELLTALG